MNTGAELPALDRVTHFWWVKLPLATRRLSLTLTIALLDGHYITGYPRVALFTSTLTPLLGLLVGWFHIGFEVAPTESLLLMILLAALGTLSAHLGTLFLAGFVVGDFVLASHQSFLVRGPIRELILVRLPLVIEYGLLGILLVSIPLMTKMLLAQLVPSPRLDRQRRLVIAILGHAALTFVLVFLWSQTAPVLIRPVFTWPGSRPTTAAIVPLQQYGYLIALAALIASVARVVLQGKMASQVEQGARPRAVEHEVQAAEPVTPLVYRVPIASRVATRTLWSTLLLSGIFQSWLAALLLGTLILLVQAARHGLVSVPLGSWPRMVERLPLIFRLIAGSMIILLLSRLFIGQAQLGSESFAPVVVLTGAALIVFFLLNPGLPGTEPASRRQP